MTYSTDTWYLVILEFNTDINKYNFVVYDANLNEIVRHDNISFGNPSGAIDRIVVYTSWDMIGDGYIDDFRFRKHTFPEPKAIINIAAALDTDGDVDTDDLAALIEQWLLEKLSADVDIGGNGRDGIVNFLDWAVFAAAWGSGSTSSNWDARCDVAPEGGDETVDVKDLAVFAEEWLKFGTYYLNADIAPEPDGDNRVNMLDFAALANNWLAGAEAEKVEQLNSGLVD